MRKLFVSVFMAALFLFCSLTQVSAAEKLLLEYDGSTHEYEGAIYSLVVNNQLLNPPLSPIIFNDRALVPVREIFEEVGATVNYIGETQTVEVVGNNSYVELKINDNVAYINGDKTNIPDNVVPKLISKVGGETKTMVPVRFISENIGLDVQFDSEDGAILIDSDSYENVDGAYQETPVEEPASVTDVSYKVEDENKISVTIEMDGEVSDYTDFQLKAPERVVIDLLGAKMSVRSDEIKVNNCGVSAIRLGGNDERARVVVDVENLRNYSVTKTGANQLTVEVTTRKIAKATPTPKPVATTAPTPKPTAAPTKKPVKKPSNGLSAGNKIIVLDAGHGGTDPGAIGHLNNNEVLEKTLTLQITYKVKSILENAGYTVSMTRTGDTLPSLEERAEQANAEDAAVFVSIHINSAEAAEAKGTEVFYAESNNSDDYGTTSQKLAKNILSRMLYYMNSINRGVKTAEHAVTRRSNMPAALAEVGFISNAEELYSMTTEEYQQKAAQGIAEGIMLTLKDIKCPE